MQAPSKTYFAVLGNFDENNIPRGKIYSTSKLVKSEFFGQIATEKLSADIQIDDLDEEEETAGMPPLPVTPPVTPTSPPSTPIESAQKTESPPPIPPASESQSPINVANNNTIPYIPTLSKMEETYVDEMKIAQRTNLPEDLPEGQLIQFPPEETKEEEKKVDSETQSKDTLQNLEQKLRALIKDKDKPKITQITKIITQILSKIKGVADEPKRNELFKTFIQKWYNIQIKINGTYQSLYDVYKSDIKKYSSYDPVKPPLNTNVVYVKPTSETKTYDDNTPTNKNEQEEWKTV